MNKVYIILVVVLLLAGSYVAGYEHAGQRYTNLANEAVGNNSLSVGKRLGEEQLGVLNNILSTLKDGDQAKAVQCVNDAIAGREKYLQRLYRLQGGDQPNKGMKADQ